MRTEDRGEGKGEMEMAEKKIAVMIYPYFSMQEISCLTSCLALWHGKAIDVFAASKDIMLSEDGFQVIANKTFPEFDIEDYNCLILPGIINPMPALFEEKNIEFLRQFAGSNLIIASISSSPLLLAKAGLLEDTEFTSGVFDKILQELDFIPKSKIRHAPVIQSGNIITAIGFAFREFAVKTIQALGIDCEETIFQGATKEFTEEELTFEMSEEHFREFMEEFRRH